jgi:hypothetical protein
MDVVNKIQCYVIIVVTADVDNCATHVAATGVCETCDDSYFEDSGACSK